MAPKEKTFSMIQLKKKVNKLATRIDSVWFKTKNLAEKDPKIISKLYESLTFKSQSFWITHLILPRFKSKSQSVSKSEQKMKAKPANSS